MSKNILLPLLLLSLLSLLSCSLPADRGETTPVLAHAFPSPSPGGFLRVQGSQVLDPSGQPVFLRGVNVDTYSYSFTWDPSAPWDYASREDIQLLASLGVNAIRLGFHWRYFETDLGYDLIDTYLEWCQEAGIYVILDLQVVPPDDVVLQGRIWSDPASRQQFLDLWSALASRYASRTIVAGYDLYNEPAPPEASQWWDLAADAAAVIRAVDADHILFVENPLIEESAFWLIPDTNVVYSLHDYNPFAVTHALASWVGDSPLPDDCSYPGPSLTAVEWVDWSQDAPGFTGQTADWLYWDSGVLTVPAGVEFASLKPLAWGDAGETWFDDLELVHNGASWAVWNPGMEAASPADPSRPSQWHFWSDSGFTGEWSREQAHRGEYSLKITSGGGQDGFGVWLQDDWILTLPLVRVQAGDTLQVRGWILAPHNQGGVNLGFDYLRGVYEDYDRSRLLADMQPYIDWALANDVPLHVGEFGSMSAAPGDSRYNLALDKISVMNEAGLGWALWTLREREPEGLTFGLFLGSRLDERLADILRQGLEVSP